MPKETKFLFPVSFDVEEEPEVEAEEEGVEKAEVAEPEEEVPSFSEEEMTAARDDAFAKGKAEGVSEAAEATEREIIGTLANLEGKFETLFQDQEKNRESSLDNAISVAVSISRKIFPALNERNGLDEIKKMIVMSLENILDEPEVTVYVNSNNAENLETHLDGMATKAGYKGKIKIVSSEEIAPGDCRVEWNGGGAKRDTTEMWTEIDEIVERNLSAITKTTPGDTETPETPPEMPPETSEVSPPETLPSDPAPEAAPETPGGEATETDPEGS